jgi:hypothetical protein
MSEDERRIAEDEKQRIPEDKKTEDKKTEDSG